MLNLLLQIGNYSFDAIVSNQKSVTSKKIILPFLYGRHKPQTSQTSNFTETQTSFTNHPHKTRQHEVGVLWGCTKFHVFVLDIR